MRKKGYMVYFILNPDNGRVKIGFTDRPVARRLSDLRIGAGVDLVLLALAPGNKTLEAELHRRYEGDWIFGEWHRGTPELLAFADRVRGLFPDMQHPTFQPIRGGVLTALTTDEVAEMLRVPLCDVLYWVETGELAAGCLDVIPEATDVHFWYVRPESFRQFLDGRKNTRRAVV